jgi:hypothetical protein
MPKKFWTPIGRLFPKKIVNHLLEMVSDVQEKTDHHRALSALERDALAQYTADLTNARIYYEKANLDFVRNIYPLVIKQQVHPNVHQLYEEILRINPQLITMKLGHEVMLQDVTRRSDD